MNWEKIKESSIAILALVFVFGLLYVIAYTPRTHERIKEKLFDEVIPFCSNEVAEDLAQYEMSDYSYSDKKIQIAIEDGFINCMSENYPSSN